MHLYKHRKCNGIALLFDVEINTVDPVHLLFLGTPGVCISKHSSLRKFDTVYRYEYLGGNLKGKCIKIRCITTINFYI